MELIAEPEGIPTIRAFPTSTPILDVLRPLNQQEAERLITGHYFLISSAVILALTELSAIGPFVKTLSRQPLPVFWAVLLILPAAAFVMAVTVHGAGHLLIGRLAGFQKVRIRIGRFAPGTGAYCEQVLSTGALVVRPKEGGRLRNRLAWLVLGGPAMSVLLAVLAEAALRLVPAPGGAGYFLLSAGIHIFSALSFLVGIAALLPDLDSTGNFSDGARLLMLLRNDARCQRWLAIVQLQMMMNRGLHPREWDESLVTQALALTDESFDTVAANWLAYLWAAGRHELTEATPYLEAALAGVGPSPGHRRARCGPEAPVCQAWYRHNLAKARFWASQIANPKF